MIPANDRLGAGEPDLPPDPSNGVAEAAGADGADRAGAVPGGAVTVELDESALALARAAAADEAGDPGLVGDAVDVYAEDAVAVTARFQAMVDGYRGWLWSVTVALLDAEHPTVSEVVLLPGPDALLAPAWVPWEQRIRSGDLGVGDLLPPAADDPRLVPAYLQSDDPAVEEVAHELGIGRVRVLSREGRAEAAERWHDGSFGPADEMALHAPGHCITCAFYLPLAGSLGLGFGACGNEYSPADGHVVDAGYGCGAHSEAISTRRARSATGDAVVDELLLEVHARRAAGRASDAGPESELAVPESELALPESEETGSDRAADEPPADEPPADEPPADEPPADEPPADEPPGDPAGQPQG